MALNIGSKILRNLPEQVAENLRQIGLIWQKLDGLDVYDNVIILEDLSNLNEEQLAIVARPVSFIVYQDVVYVKKGNVGAYALFSPYYSIEADEYITIKSSELKVQFPLGEVTISGLEVELYDKPEIDTLLSGINTLIGTKLNTSELLNKTYPIGAIYLSTVSTSPASLFGGTWEQIQDKFLVGTGTRSSGAEGGNETHRHGLSTARANLVFLSSQGAIYYEEGGDPSAWHANVTVSNLSGSGVDYNPSGSTKLNGNTDSASNIPPYIAVNMWKRVA